MRIIGILLKPNGITTYQADLVALLIAFNDAHMNPLCKFENGNESDEMRPIYSALAENDRLDTELELHLLRLVKIPLRKQSNRSQIGKHGLNSLIRALRRQSIIHYINASEVVNAILNACYNGENVGLFVENGGVEPLVQLLCLKDSSILSSVLGAIQGICYVPLGRLEVRRYDIIPTIVNCLTITNELVRARAVGCIHNISADSSAIPILRVSGCIPYLCVLLREYSPEVCQAAAGAIQNISREAESRQIFQDICCVPMLIDLIFSNDVKCQVAAIGAVLNILGPDLTTESYASLREALTEGLIIGILQSCIFDSSSA